MTDQRVNLMRPTPTSFLCCICFAHVEASSAYQDPVGDRWGMCQSCGEEEERSHIWIWWAGRCGMVRFG